jgi:hypothetical protein
MCILYVAFKNIGVTALVDGLVIIPQLYVAFKNIGVTAQNE